MNIQSEKEKIEDLKNRMLISSSGPKMELAQAETISNHILVDKKHCLLAK